MNPHIFLRSTTLLAALLLVVPSLSARAGVDISVGGTTNLAPLLIHWNDVGGSDRRIALIGREIGTGTRFVFEDNVAKTTIPIRVEANATAVLNAVASTSGALEYLASGFLGNHQDLLVAYQGVMPTPVTIRTREYRFSTSEHLYTYNNPRPDVAAFVQYVESSTDQLRANGIY